MENTALDIDKLTQYVTPYLNTNTVDGLKDGSITADNCDVPLLQVLLVINDILEDYKWRPIATAPKDDSEFYVGMFKGEKAWNNDYTEFVWIGEPVWVQALSHRENPNGPHVLRGWNHHNGPLGGYATHWARKLPPPSHIHSVLHDSDEIVT